jgi:hypothetical protein
LLDDVQAPGITRGGGEVDGPVEAARDLDGAQALAGSRGRSRPGLGVRAAAGDDERDA